MGCCSFPFVFHLCFLSLILRRTDLGVEPSTRWKYLWQKLDSLSFIQPLFHVNILCFIIRRTTGLLQPL